LIRMWIGAARYADLNQETLVHSTYPHHDIWEIRFGVWKSDRTGSRRFVKFLHVPRKLGIRPEPSAPQTAVDTFLRSMGQFTKHSFRKGALDFLAHHFSPEQAILLSGHTPITDTAKSLAPYVHPQPHHERGRLQLQMSRLLALQLF
jgi:hypothetical protein